MAEAVLLTKGLRASLQCLKHRRILSEEGDEVMMMRGVRNCLIANAPGQQVGIWLGLSALTQIDSGDFRNDPSIIRPWTRIRGVDR